MMTEKTAYRSAVGVGLAAALILVWLSLGVGIIGAFFAHFHPLGMARALFATALAQTSVAMIALTAGLGRPWSGPLELLFLNGFFVALFIGSAWLFRRAASGTSKRGVAV